MTQKGSSRLSTRGQSASIRLRYLAHLGQNQSQF